MFIIKKANSDTLRDFSVNQLNGKARQMLTVPFSELLKL